MAAELDPAVTDEKPLETILSPKQSIKSGEVENAEAKVRASIKSSKDEENGEAKKSPSPSIKSGGAETAKEKEVDVEGGGKQSAEGVETPQIIKGEGEEKEAPPAPEEVPPALEEAPPAPEEAPPAQEEAPPALEAPPAPEAPEIVPVPEEAETEEPVQPEASKEVKGSQELPTPRGSRRVSFGDEDQPFAPQQKGFKDKLEMPQQKGGFKSNKDVKLPSIKDLDPEPGPRPGTRDRMTSITRPGHPQQMQPWLVMLILFFVLTIIMRFFMSNFKFVGAAVYAGMVSLLALRYYGRGPLATGRGRVARR